MKREKAIKYLKGKHEIEENYSKEEEKKIKKVMKEGKIYGDPQAEIQWE